MRRSEILIAILIILVVLLLVFRIFTFIKGDSAYDQVIAGENITEVKLSANKGDIEISSYDGNEIRIHLVGKTEGKLSKRYKLKVKEKGNQVIIEAKKKSRFSQNFIMVVELPEKQFELIQVEAKVANIDVSTISAKNFYLKTKVGNITTKDTDGVLEANTEVGNVNLQFQEITNNIAAKTAVGNVVVKTERAPEALQTSCKTDVGRTTLNLPNLTNGAIGTGGPNVTLTSEVGDVSLLLVGE